MFRGQPRKGNNPIVDRGLGGRIDIALGAAALAVFLAASPANGLDGSVDSEPLTTELPIPEGETAVAPLDPPAEETAAVSAPPSDEFARTRADIEEGRTREARRDLQAYLKAQPTSAEALTLLGQVELAEGSESRALRRFKQALKHNPHFAPAYLGRGRVYERRGKWDEAANEYRAAALSDPDNSEARLSLSRLQTEIETVP